MGLTNKNIKKTPKKTELIELGKINIESNPAAYQSYASSIAAQQFLRLPSVPTANLPTPAAANVGGLLYDSTAGVLKRSNGSAWANIEGLGSVSLDTAYGNGATVTVDAANLILNLNDSSNDYHVQINNATTGTIATGLLVDTSGASAGCILTDAIKVTTSGAGSSITDAIDVSDAGITNALTAGGNDLSGTNWSITGSTGAAIFVGVNYGSGSLVGTGNIAISTDKFQVTGASGNTTIAGTLTLSSASSDITVNTNMFTVDATQGNTVIAGTCDIGGATTVTGTFGVTGNSTLTGDLEVTGSLTFGGNWTVGATLTVDELILDTDGVQPANTNCYWVRDNAGDLTGNAITGKTINLAIAGTDEYAFGASSVDLNGNHLDNAGYLILNEVTLPANTECYIGRDNTGDTTVNALTGKEVHIAVAATDLLDISESEVCINEGSGDVDFRFESNATDPFFVLDGGSDLVGIGAAASAAKFVGVTPPARTLASAAEYVSLHVEPAGAVTTAGDASTSDYICTAYFAEPNITNGGGDTITVAATVYIKDAPTEGSANYALDVAAGATNLAGAVTCGSTITGVDDISIDADDKVLSIGDGQDFEIDWSTADGDNHAAVMKLGASNALHICADGDEGSDWNVAAASDPTLYIHGATTPITEYISIYDDETDAHLNAQGANWSFEIGGTAELTLAANALNLVDSVLYGSTAAHTGDTADGSLYLHSTSNATKGWVCIPDTHLGLVIGSDGSVDRNNTVGTNAIHIFNGTAPVGTLTNGCSIYSSGGELYTMDAGGNATVQTPHDADNRWVFHSKHTPTGRVFHVDMEKFFKWAAKKFPDEVGQFVREYVE